MVLCHQIFSSQAKVECVLDNLNVIRGPVLMVLGLRRVMLNASTEVGKNADNAPR